MSQEDHPAEENLNVILYINNLQKKFNRKFDEQLTIIEQQRERIDVQRQLIDDQRATMDELAWQIRDLRDSVRQCCEKINIYENEKPQVKNSTVCCCCCSCRHHDTDKNKNNKEKINNNNNNNKIDVNNNHTSNCNSNDDDDSDHDNSCSCSANGRYNVNRRNNLNRQNHVQDDDTAIYESIHFDNADVIAKLQNIQLSSHNKLNQQQQPPPVPARRVNISRQSAFQHNNSLYGMDSDDYELIIKASNNNNGAIKGQSHHSKPAAVTLKNYLATAVPPPPSSTPPPLTPQKPNGQMFVNFDKERKQISAGTIDKLNTLFDLQRLRHTKNDDDNMSEIKENSDDDISVEYRVKEFKDYSRRSRRGSSKAMWSLISDADGEYLPAVDEEDQEEDDHENYNKIYPQRDFLRNPKQTEIIRKPELCTSNSDDQHANGNPNGHHRGTYTKNMTTEMFI